MNRLVFVGGYSAPRSVLESTGAALASQREIDGVDVFSFREAIEDPSRLSSALRSLPRSRVMLASHSAGITALLPEMRPDRIVALAGPTPRSTRELLAGAAMLTVDLARQKEHALNLKKGLEIAAHPLLHLAQLRAIGKFSTANLLNNVQTSLGIPCDAVAMSQDRFFPLEQVQADFTAHFGAEYVHVAEGGHDEVLVDPQIAHNLATIANS